MWKKKHESIVAQPSDLKTLNYLYLDSVDLDLRQSIQEQNLLKTAFKKLRGYSPPETMPLQIFKVCLLQILLS